MKYKPGYWDYENDGTILAGYPIEVRIKFQNSLSTGEFKVSIGENEVKKDMVRGLDRFVKGLWVGTFNTWPKFTGSMGSKYFINISVNTLISNMNFDSNPDTIPSYNYCTNDWDIGYEPGVDTNHYVWIYVPPPNPREVADETEAVTANIQNITVYSIQEKAKSKIAVLRNGFYKDTIKYLTEKLHLKVDVIDTNISYDKLADTKILVIPTGGFYQIESEQFRDILREYVKNGGNIVCFTQARNKDFKNLPVPDGEQQNFWGYTEDASCWLRSINLNITEHPVISGMNKSEGLNISVDGYIREWPRNSKEILMRTRNWMPAYIIYNIQNTGDTTAAISNQQSAMSENTINNNPEGGNIVVTNIYSDWGANNNQASDDDLKLWRDTISWLMKPEMLRDIIIESESQRVRESGENQNTIQVYEPQEIMFGPIAIKNTSLDTTKYARIWVNSPDKQVKREKKWEVTLPPGVETQENIRVMLDSSSMLGVWNVGWEIQAMSNEQLAMSEETSVRESQVQEEWAGNFTVRKILNQNYAKPELTVSIQSERDHFFRGETGNFPVIIRNLSNEDKSITCKLDFPHHSLMNFHILEKDYYELNIAANSEIALEVKAGPLAISDFMLVEIFQKLQLKVRCTRGFFVDQTELDIALEMGLDKDYYLPGENIEINLKIINPLEQTQAFNNLILTMKRALNNEEKWKDSTLIESIKAYETINIVKNIQFETVH